MTIVRPRSCCKGGSSVVNWGEILGNITSQTDLIAYIAANGGSFKTIDFTASDDTYPSASTIKKDAVYKPINGATYKGSFIVANGALFIALVDNPGNNVLNWMIVPTI